MTKTASRKKGDNMKRGRIRTAAFLCAAGLAGAFFAGCTGTEQTAAEPSESEITEKAGEETAKEAAALSGAGWEEAAATPYGKYPELVTYTLGKMIGDNNSNMPEGDTYENNVYTRYLRETLNIQNENVFEEKEEQYTTNVQMAIAARQLPDVMVVEDRETLQQLAESGMIADLGDAYESCASEGLKQMYESYEASALETAVVEEKLMALPEPSFVDGPLLLWLRRDWMEKLGLSEPESAEDVVEIVRAFIREDPGGNGEGNTVGLVCHSDLTGENGYNYEFQLDPLFSAFGAFPKQWIQKEDGSAAYGSVQAEAKEALAFLRELYAEGILDQSFMLRSMGNIVELIVEGKCGSFFGPWWAPNNPLMEAREKNPEAVWEPYLIGGKDGKVRYYDQEASYKYVVVSAEFEHPELVFKMASVMFDKMRYEDSENDELENYFQLNVDSTARPLSINIDYSDALYRCYEQISAALNGEFSPQKLQILEHSYYTKCKAYLEHPETADAEEWAAYESRIKACSLMSGGWLEVISPVFSGETETMKEKWAELLALEKKAYLEIISGERELDYFDGFVEEWMEKGGEKITQEVACSLKSA